MKTVSVSLSLSVPEWHRGGSLILAASLWALAAAAQAQDKPASEPAPPSASASATSATTPRSWVMSTMAAPTRDLRSRIRSRICA